MQNIINITNVLLQQGFMKSSNLDDFRTNIVAPIIDSVGQKVGHNLNKTEIQSVINAVQGFYEKNGMKINLEMDSASLLHFTTAIADLNDNLFIKFIVKFIKEFAKKQNIEIQNLKDFTEILKYANTTLSPQNDTSLLFLNENNIRHMVRLAAKQVFKLGARDCIFFTQNSIIVKDFDYDLVRMNEEIRRIQKAKTYEVIDSRDKEKLMSVLEVNKAYLLLTEATNNVLASKINLNTIKALDFAKNFNFFLIQSLMILFDGLISSVSHTSKILFCEELININKNMIYQNIAHKLLENLMQEDNHNAIEFIGFLNGRTILLAKTRIKMPVVKSNNHIYETKEALVIAEDYFSYIKNKMNLNLQIEEFLSEIGGLNADILTLQQNVKTLKDNLDAMNFEYEEKKVEIKKLRIENSLHPKIKILETETSAIFDQKQKTLNEIERKYAEIQDKQREISTATNKRFELEKQLEQEDLLNNKKIDQFDIYKNSLATSIGNMCATILGKI